MPSASPPDDASPAGEVVEVFTGDTLEEAMATAVAALGPDLTVRRARKVRAGVRGLLGRDRYEVLAVPADGPPALRSAPADGEDAVGSALEALLEAADEREAGGPPARPVGRPTAARPLAARPASEELPPPLRGAAAGPTAPLPPAPRSSGSPLRRGGRSRGAAPEETDEPRRRGRVLGGGPLSGSSPHPDPAVAEHPAERSTERPAERAAERPAERVGPPEPAPAPEAPAPPRAAARPAPTRVPPLAVVPDPLEPLDVLDEADADVDSEVYDQEADVELEPVRPARRPESPRRRSPSPEPVQVIDAPEPPPVRTPRAAEPAARAPRKAAAKKQRAGGWSLGALSALGVPDQVLDALPGPVPRDDLAWVVALTAAIERCVPPPAEPDEQTPVVVSGHGLAGAVAVLDAGCRGLAPGTITHAGRTAPATATELALVLRHHVTAGG